MGPSKGAAQRLRELREEAGLTQKEAAALLGVDLGTVNRKEKGRTPATERDVLAAQVAYRRNRQDANATGQADTAENENAPTGGAGADLIEDVRASVRGSLTYWLIRQELAAEITEELEALQHHIEGLAAQARRKAGQALQMQRELIAGTLPTPVADAEARRRFLQATLDEEARLARERQQLQEQRDQPQARRRAAGGGSAGAGPTPPAPSASQRGGGGRTRRRPPDSPA